MMIKVQTNINRTFSMLWSASNNFYALFHQKISEDDLIFFNVFVKFGVVYFLHLIATEKNIKRQFRVFIAYTILSLC